MKVSTVVDRIALQLDDENSIQIGLREAFGLLMFSTGVGWAKDGLTTYHGALAADFKFSDREASWPVQTATRFVVNGNGVETEGDDTNVPYETLLFVLGPHVDQQFEANRLDLMRQLSALMFSVTGNDKFTMMRDDYHLSEEKFIPTGYGEVTISNGSYVNLYIPDQHGTPRRLVDVDAFNGNQNLKRAGHVSKLAFASDTYFSEYRGADEKAMLQVFLASNATMLKDA